ncbi:hypothetical protein [Bowmanella denitrificans]|uniref:hypothetical protein n=1 Tax=Bowmanella denitrificans TaxID=366582 RepID=UPI000C9A17CE|nr:hypothetical protein [Bowmanella denitrificans]
MQRKFITTAALLLVLVLGGCTTNNARQFACDVAEGTVESAKDKRHESDEGINDNDLANGLFTATLRGLIGLLSSEKPKRACT